MNDIEISKNLDGQYVITPLSDAAKNSKWFNDTEELSYSTVQESIEALNEMMIVSGLNGYIGPELTKELMEALNQ